MFTLFLLISFTLLLSPLTTKNDIPFGVTSDNVEIDMLREIRAEVQALNARSGKKTTHQSISTLSEHLNYYVAAEKQHKLSGLAASYGEDIFLWTLFFSRAEKIQQKLFIELGAENGMAGSNTFYFQKVHGWGGFLIEPFPPQCERITASREHDNVHIICPMAVCAEVGDSAGGKAHYFIGGQGGFTLDAAADDQTKLLVNCAGKECLTTAKDLMQDVSCAKLSSIIRTAYGSPPPVIHFFSLDCEGCEDVALKTFDWENTILALLMIEMVEGKNCGGRVENCVEVLQENGMVLWGIVQGGDSVWYNPKYFADQELPIPRYEEDYMTAITAKQHELWNIGNVLWTAFNDAVKNGF